MFTTCTAIWGGFNGAPGYTKMKFLGNLTVTEANSALAKMRTFFAALSTYLPAATSINFQAACEHHDDQGLITGYVTASTVPVAVAGAGTGLYSSAAGACLTWYTNGWSLGRRITGRTFLVPLSPTQCFQNDGTLSSTFITAALAAAAALRTGTPTLVIFSHKVTADGIHSYALPNVVSENMVDRAGVLRSRR